MRKLTELLVPKNIPSVLLLALLVIMFLFPAFGGDNTLSVLEYILILCLFSLSINLLLGYTGLLSFGQALFYATGAYASAKIVLAYPNLLAGVIGGIVIAAVLAFIVGWFCIRHTRIYFSMITLAFGMVGYSFFLESSFFGGTGLSIPNAPIVIPHVFSISMTSHFAEYYFVVIVALIAIFLLYRLVHSPLGLVFKGIRDSESRIAFTGISISKMRLLSFVISGIYAGLAGTLSAFVNLAVDPFASHWVTSIDPIIATLLGGMYTFSGPIVGSILLYIAKYIIVSYTMQWMLPLGVLIIALVLGLRGGVVGSLEQRLFPWLRSRLAERSRRERIDIKH